MRENDHQCYMRRASNLARHVPHLPFGAVIVNRDDQTIIADGWDKSDNNPTWHGEIDAINQLILSGSSRIRSDLVLYTTAEPCPMCLGAILWISIETVVYGTSIPFLQQHGWWQIDIRSEEIVRRSPERNCQIVAGILEEE